MSQPPRRPGSREEDGTRAGNDMRGTESGTGGPSITFADEQPASSSGSQQQQNANETRWTPDGPPPRLQRPAVLRGFREPSIRLRRRDQGASAASLDDVSISSNLSAPLPPIPSPSNLEQQQQQRRRRFPALLGGRSLSEPQGPMLLQQARASSGTAASSTPRRPSPAPPHMPVVVEELPMEGTAMLDASDDLSIAGSAPPLLEPADVNREMVDILDAVDPEVSTLTTLTNMQNSLFVPNLGRFISRRPLYTLTPVPTRTGAAPAPSPEPVKSGEQAESKSRLQRMSTITSTLEDTRYAVLPHGTDLQGWSQAEKDELNDHVRHMLHSRRSKIRRGFRGFLQYCKTPLGFFITLYATLITLFGLAWVLFLIGWISVGSKQLYVINVIDNVLVALFAIMGDGLAPFRAWDTYNMVFVVHYHRKTLKLRRKKALADLSNKNDLPTEREENIGLEAQEADDYIVLNEKQQASLELHERRLCKSHTFDKPHETATHFAFPVKLLIIIQMLLDSHSLLQISLGTCTWAIDYRHRPFALTTVILCCSITANITAGVLISIGDHRTRKKDVMERINRQEMTSEAIEMIEKRRQRERERNQELDEGLDGLGAVEAGAEKSGEESDVQPVKKETEEKKSAKDLNAKPVKMSGAESSKSVPVGGSA